MKKHEVQEGGTSSPVSTIQGTNLPIIRPARGVRQSLARLLHGVPENGVRIENIDQEIDQVFARAAIGLQKIKAIIHWAATEGNRSDSDRKYVKEIIHQINSLVAGYWKVTIAGEPLPPDDVVWKKLQLARQVNILFDEINHIFDNYEKNNNAEIGGKNKAINGIALIKEIAQILEQMSPVLIELKTPYQRPKKEMGFV